MRFLVTAEPVLDRSAVAVSSTLRVTASAGRSSCASSNAARQRSSSPRERNDDARATRTSTWRSSRAGRRRSAASNQRAAAAGALSAAAAPASSMRPIASCRPLRTAPHGVRARPLSAARSERVARACMRSEPPTGGRPRRPRVARVTKSEPPRHRGRTNQIERQQGVQRVEAVRRRQLGDRLRIRLERISCDRSGTQQHELRDRQGGELLGQRNRDRGRNGHPGHRDGVAILVQHQPLLAGPSELVEVEGVAAAMAEDGRGRSRLHAGEQLGRLGSVSGSREIRPTAGLPSAAERRIGPGLADRRAQEDRRLGSAPKERGQQLDRCLVGPMEVVEHDDQRAVPCEELEQLSRGPVDAVALVGNGPALALGGTAQGRKDVGELPRVLLAPRFAELELLGGNVGVQRVGPDAERQVPLELRRRTAENGTCALQPGDSAR